MLEIVCKQKLRTLVSRIITTCSFIFVTSNEQFQRVSSTNKADFHLLSRALAFMIDQNGYDAQDINDFMTVIYIATTVHLQDLMDYVINRLSE